MNITQMRMQISDIIVTDEGKTAGVYRMNRQERWEQMSDTFRLGAVLAMAGGFMDAYSYILRDQVFANAQTGNMLLLGVALSQGDYMLALRYFFPVMSFAIGISIAEFIRYYSQKQIRNEREIIVHWRQKAVLVEIVFLFVVSFLPLSVNVIANCLTSLGCGIQVQSFRKIHGNASATTMCIGNLRSATQHMCSFITTRKKSSFRKSILYFGIIGCFMIGAILGNICIGFFRERAILFCIFLLIIAFGLMFMEQVHSIEI